VKEFMDFQWQLRGKVLLRFFSIDATEWVICVLPNCLGGGEKNNIYGFMRG
jgi:hypothetical protein